MKKIFKIIKRIIVLPCVFGILLVTHLSFVIHRTYLFLLYGGYFKEHDKNDNYETVTKDLNNMKYSYEAATKRLTEAEEYVKSLVKRVERQQEIITKHQQKKINKSSDEACEGK